MPTASGYTPRILGSTSSFSGIATTTRRSLRSSGPPSREPQRRAKSEEELSDRHHCLQTVSWLQKMLPAGMCVVQGGTMKHQELMWELNGSNLSKKTNFILRHLPFPPLQLRDAVAHQEDRSKSVLSRQFIMGIRRRSLSNTTFQAGLGYPVRKPRSIFH